MNLLKRLEILEAALLRRGGDSGYKIVVAKVGETPQETVTRTGLMKWPPDRIIFIIFVKVGL